MKTCTRWALAGFVLIAAHFACEPEVQAQQVCAEGSSGNHDWDAFSEIRVYIHPDLARNLETSDGFPYSDSELRRDIKATLHALQEQLAAGHPKLVLQSGYSTVSWTQGMGPGTIHVAPWLDSTANCTSAPNGSYGGNASVGGLIVFKRSGPGYVGGLSQGWQDCNTQWAHFEPTGQYRTFRGTLIHEVMHGFGNKHSNCVTILPCDQPTVGCSCGANGAGTTYDGWDCFLHDRQRMLDNHAVFSSSTPAPARVHEEALDAVSWFPLSPPIPHAPLVGMSSANSSYMFAALRRPDSTNIYGRLYRWVFSTQAWEYWGYLTSTADNILGAVGVSFGGTPAYPYVAHTSSTSASDPLKAIQVTRFTGPSQKSTWTLGNDVTRKDGVAIAYDPVTQWHVLVWRDDRMAIWTTLFHPSYGFGLSQALYDGATPVHSPHAPDLVCGDSSVGTYNCVLVWAAPMDSNEGSLTYQKLRWIHFRVVVGGFTPYLVYSNHMQQGYVQHGAPRVSYRGPSSSAAAFVIAWGDVGNSYYTIGKGKSTTAYWDWTTYRYHSSPSGTYSYSPTIGSAAGASELMEQYR